MGLQVYYTMETEWNAKPSRTLVLPNLAFIAPVGFDLLSSIKMNG